MTQEGYLFDAKGNTAGAVEALSDLNKALISNEGSLLKWKATLQKVTVGTDENERVVDKLTLAQERLLSSGKKLTQQLQFQGTDLIKDSKSIELLAKSAEKAATKTELLAQRMQKLAQGSTGAFLEKVNSQFRIYANNTKISTQETLNYQKAQEGLKRALAQEGKSNLTGVKKLEAAWERILNNKRIYSKNPKDQGVIQALETMARSVKAIGTEAKISQKALDEMAKASLKTAMAERKTKETGAFSAGLDSKIAWKNITTPAQMIEIARAADQATLAFNKTELSSNKFSEIFSEGMTGKVKNYRGEMLKAYEAGNQFNKSLNVVSEGAKKTGNEIKKTGEKVTSLAVTWKSFVRFFVIRSIYNSFHKLTAAIKNAVVQAAELSVAISEVQTLINRFDQTNSGFDRLYASAFRLSNYLNFEVMDVAESFYQGLSNQITNTASDIDYFASVTGKLAKATVSSLETSTNAISSIINAYGASIIDITEISAIYFKMIEEGRIRLKDTEGIGRVAIIAAQVGVEFKELASALATLTIAGVKQRESITGTRALLQKLVMPTKEMTKLFKDWNVSSGQAAIATFGFTGILERFAEVSKEGGMTDIGKLVGRIRAWQALSGFTGGIKDYEKSLDGMEEAEDRFTTAFDLIYKNRGETFKREMNKIKNYLIEDLGSALMNATLGTKDLAEALGFDLANSVDTIVKSIITLTTALTSAYATTLLLTKAQSVFVLGKALFTAATAASTGAIGAETAAVIANTKAKTIGAVLTGNWIKIASIAVSATVAGVIAYNLLGDSVKASFRKINESAAKSLERVKAKYFDKLKKEYDEIDERIKKTTRQGYLDISNARGAIKDQLEGNEKIFKERKEAWELEKKMLDDLSNGNLIKQEIAEKSQFINDLEKSNHGINILSLENLKKQKEAHEGIFGQLRGESNELAKQLENLRQQKLLLNQGSIDKQFEIFLQSLNDYDKIRAKLDRSQDLYKEGRFLIDNGEFKKAEVVLKKARSLLESAQSESFSTGFFGKISNYLNYFSQAHKTLDKIEQQSLDTQLKREKLFLTETERTEKLLKLEKDRREVALDYIKRKENIDKDSATTPEEKKRLAAILTGHVAQDNVLSAQIRDNFLSMVDSSQRMLDLAVAETQLRQKSEELSAIREQEKEIAAGIKTPEAVAISAQALKESIEAALPKFLSGDRAFTRDGKRIVPIETQIRRSLPEVDKLIQEIALNGENLSGGELEKLYEKLFRAETAIINKLSFSSRYEGLMKDFIEQMKIQKTEARKSIEDKKKLEANQQLSAKVEGELNVTKDRITQAGRNFGTTAAIAQKETQDRIAANGPSNQAINNAKIIGEVTADAQKERSDYWANVKSNTGSWWGEEENNWWGAWADAANKKKERDAWTTGNISDEDKWWGKWSQTSKIPDPNRFDEWRQEAEVFGNVSAEAHKAKMDAIAAKGPSPEEVNKQIELQRQAALHGLTKEEYDKEVRKGTIAGAEQLRIISNVINKGNMPGTYHLAKGGFIPKGTDTVPAMLTPGEFVVNAASTRKYLPLLRGINSLSPRVISNSSPSYYSSGGEVTVNNRNSFNISSSGNSRVDARTLAKHLNRETRKGTIKLGTPRRVYG